MAGRSRRTAFAVLSVVVTVAAHLGALAAPAGAVVTATTGQLIKIAPPADVRPAGICSQDKVFTFDEQQGVTLGAQVKVDYTEPGSYSSYPPGSFVPKIPAGTVVDSHFLDSSRDGCMQGSVIQREGTWKFNQDILGVIVHRDRLNLSDFLGSPTTEYGGAYPSREFDWGNTGTSDFVQVVDARTIYVKVQTGGNSDQMRVLTKHNQAPVPNAGGPYAGNEGSAVPLAGTATDPDGDTITKSWSFTWTASPGTTCSTTGTGTLTPSITCNDDALVTATLSVTDGYHPAVTSVANVTISNKAPTISSVTLPTGPVALGASVPLSAIFGDVGTHDTHTATIAWGDTTSSSGTVNEPLHTVAAAHAYTTPGTFSVTLTVNDDDGGTVTSGPVDVTVVGPPTAGAGGPYNGNEGSTITLAGSATGSLPLSKSWTFTPGPADPGTVCNYTGTTTLSPTVSCNDDVVVGATLTVNDSVNAPVVSATSVAVDNEAPVLSPLTATTGPIVAGQPITVGGTFTDAGTNDTHTSTVDWGDMATSPGTVLESSGSGSVSGGHTYAAPGLYTVSVDVNDGDGGIATRTIVVRVNTPPTANAEGPYAGPEGSTLTLGGSATDPDPDVLTIGWTFVVTGAPPSACTFGATTTLAPTVLCTDNATVTATLSVDDGVHSPTLSVATVNVGNVAPSVGTLTAVPNPVALLAPVTASVPFSDAGTSDTHTATVDWGDGNVTPATVSETLGAGTASGTHPYALPGSYLVSITVTDDDLDYSTTSAVTVVVNTPPTASAGGPYTVSEGSPLTLAGSAADADLDPLSVSWTFGVAGSPGTACVATGTSTVTPSITCNDNATVTATLTVNDGINAPVASVATITVTNLPPTAHPVTPSVPTLPAGATLSVSTGFTDPGSNDTHPATVLWGDGGFSPATVVESAGTGTASASHVYSLPGSYTITMFVLDDDGGFTLVTTSTPVVVT